MPASQHLADNSRVFGLIRDAADVIGLTRCLRNRGIDISGLATVTRNIGVKE
ncbi:hypothetical protein [Microcoleus sp. BROC3]|uniref:hypothetical protein n=1 Tax=Microcoleus sp. BROC3 TaxID=3055323 RepID=UPI002FD5BFFF